MTAEAKPTQREYGRIGARRRWGDPGSVPLDGLTPEQRRLVLALVAAARSNEKAAPVSETSGTASAEGHGNGSAG